MNKTCRSVFIAYLLAVGIGVMPLEQLAMAAEVVAETENVQVIKVEPDLQAHATLPDEMVQVTKNKIPLASNRLRKQYQGYKISIQNSGKNPIDLINANLSGATSGNEAYLMVEKSTGALIGGLLAGGFVLSIVTFGITFLLALLAWPIIGGVNHHKNKKALRESLKYTDDVPLGTVNVGESLAFETLVPSGKSAQIKLTFRDTVTKELYSVTK